MRVYTQSEGSDLELAALRRLIIWWTFSSSRVRRERDERSALPQHTFPEEPDQLIYQMVWSGFFEEAWANIILPAVDETSLEKQLIRWREQDETAAVLKRLQSQNLPLLTFIIVTFALRAHSVRNVRVPDEMAPDCTTGATLRPGSSQDSSADAMPRSYRWCKNPLSACLQNKEFIQWVENIFFHLDPGARLMAWPSLVLVRTVSW